MAYPVLAICFIISILYPVAYSQDVPHIRHHRHSHPAKPLSRTAVHSADQSSDERADEYYDFNKDRRPGKTERGEDDGIMLGKYDMMNDSVLDGPISPAFPDHPSLFGKESSDGRKTQHNLRNHDNFEDQGALSDGSRVSQAHYPRSTEHPFNQQDSGTDDSETEAELFTSSHLYVFSRPNKKETKAKTRSPKTTESPKSSFLAALFRIMSTAGDSPQKTRKEQRKQTKQTPNKKQENRPKWYLQQNRQGGINGKRIKSRPSKTPHDGDARYSVSKKPRTKKHLNTSKKLFMQYSNVPETDSNQYAYKIGHKITKTAHVSNRKTAAEKEKEKRHRRPDASKKPASQKGRQSKRLRKRPLIKECVGCTEVEAKIAEARELHKQVLKAQLLDKLRLVPTLTHRPLPPKLPEQVFPGLPQQDHVGYEDQYYAEPTHLLIFGRDLGKRRLRKPATGSYEFDVRGKVKGQVTKADLWVYKMPDARDSHGQTLAITQLHYNKGHRLRERSLVARLDTHVHEGWVRFDVTRAVHRWLESETKSASSHILAIRCKTCHRTSYRAIFGVKSNFRPVLVIRERRQPPQDSPREKRSSSCDPSSRCCKFDLTVRFHDLGIHEIFYPKSIRTGYCYGTCERPDLHYHNHTMIMQRLRYGSYQPVNETLRERLKPCCVPVVLREASIMHYVNEGLDTQVSLIPNLLVDKCGCA